MKYFDNNFPSNSRSAGDSNGDKGKKKFVNWFFPDKLGGILPSDFTKRYDNSPKEGPGSSGGKKASKTLSLTLASAGQKGEYIEGYTRDIIARPSMPQTTDITLPSGETINVSVLVREIKDDDLGPYATTAVRKEVKGVCFASPDVTLRVGGTIFRVHDGVYLKAVEFGEDVNGRYVHIEIIVDGGWREEKKKKEVCVQKEILYEPIRPHNTGAAPKGETVKEGKKFIVYFDK
jgi:hypothetical protein